MAAIPLVLHRRSFDTGRLRAQRRGASVLVMDRISGRWCALDQEWASVLPLVGDVAGEHTVPAAARLRTYLEEHRIGTRGADAEFASLNTLIVKLTAACNHACAYCYDFEEAFGARRIDERTAIASVRQALEQCAEALQVILHGGEPMLVWDLVEAVVAAGERDAERLGKTIRFVGQSNMSLLSPRIGRFSVDHDIAWGVSVDGPADIHDHFRTYRNGRGTYADFQRSLDAYPRFLRGCGVLSTITTANQARLLEVARHFRDLGMPSWDWTLFQPIGRGRADADRFEPDLDTIVDGWNSLFDAVLDGEFDGFRVLPILKYVENFVRGPGPNMCMRPQCGAGRDLASVSVDGAIEACDCIDRTGPLAHLGVLDPDADDSLAVARDSEVAHVIRSRDLSETRCGTCIWWGVCGGGCLAHAASLNEIPDLACALALTAFDRIADELVDPTRDALRRYLATVDHVPAQS